MEQENKKFHFRLEYGIAILLIILYLFLYIFSTSIKKSDKKGEEPIYIVINTKHQFAYQNGKVSNAVDWNQIYGTKKFYSYNDSTYLGQYKLMQYDTALYLFDDNQNSVEYDGELFTYSSPQKIETVNSNFVSLDNEIKLVLNELIQKNNLVMPAENNLAFLQKIPVDLDGNGDNEIIYAISSYPDVQSLQAFSFLYYEDNGKLYELLSNSTLTTDNVNYYSITQAMDLDNDKKKELIVRRIKYQTAAVEDYMILKDTGDGYKEIASGL